MSESTNNTGRKRRWKWIVLPLLAVLLLPTLLTVTGKHSAVLRWLQPELAEVLRYESLSTHWWQAIQIDKVRMVESLDTDQDAIPVFSAVRIRSRQPLWQLVFMGGRLDFECEQPVLNLIAQDGHSNLQSMLQRLQSDESKPNSQRAMSLSIRNGLVRLVSAPSGEPEPVVREIRNINGQLTTHQTALLPEILLSADIDESSPASLLTKEAVQQIAANLSDATADFPLQPFEDQALSPPLDSEPTCQLRVTAPDDGVQQLFLESHQLNLATIRPVLELLWPEIKLEGRISCRAQAQVIAPETTHNRLGLAARVQFLGEDIQLRHNQWAAGDVLTMQTVTSSGAFALAEDGVLLKDVQLTSNLFEVAGSGAVQYRAPDPVAAFSISEQTPNRQSAVAQATAASSGTARLSGQLDLAAILQQLKNTVQLTNGTELQSGTLEFTARMQQQVPPTGSIERSTTNGFDWEFAAVTSPLQATRSGRAISVPSKIRFDAKGGWRQSIPTLDTASIGSAFGQLQVAPLDDGYRLTGTVKPQEAWRQLSGILEIERPAITSDLQLKADIQSQENVWIVSNAEVDSSGLQIRTDQLLFDGTRPVFDAFDGRLDVQGNSSAIKAVLLPFHDAWWLADHCDVAGRLTAVPNQELILQAAIRRSGPKVSEDFSIDTARLLLRLVPQSDRRSCLVENSSVDIPGLQADVSGMLSQREGLIHVNLVADSDCNLEQLTSDFLDIESMLSLEGQPRVRIQLQGCPALLTLQDLNRHRRQYPTSEHAMSLQTQSLSEERPVETFQIAAVVPWQSGQIMSMPLGPGQIDARLQEGVLTSEPIQCAFGTGEMAVMPRWDLQTNVVQLAAGSRIQNFRLTPSLSRQWLSSIAPLFAESANVDGMASVRVQRFVYPIDQPETANIAGTLSLAESSAAAGPSLAPLLQVLTAISRQNFSSRRLVLPAQDVMFQMQNGWIQHNRLRMDINDYLMESSGAVNMNGQIQLTLDVPLEKSRAGQRGRLVSVPVRGTTKRPQLDVAGLWQSIGRQQIQGRLNEEVDRGLNRLLDKLR